ncbi:MAG TPA: M28 family metallopeptidase [Thermoleophilaceae bacterium]
MRLLRLTAVIAAVLAVSATAAPASAARLRANRFSESGALHWVRIQLGYGPRPAGSPAARRLSARLRSALPHSHFEPVPGGLRNVIGVVPGRDRRDVVVVGAHYDTKDIPGFLGANDGAAGTAIVLELARHLRSRHLRATVVFALFDGEESPGDTPDSEFEQRGLRGSKVAARAYRKARAMILLDFVGNAHLRIPREESSDPGLWQMLRAAAMEVGASGAFPSGTGPDILDDHTPFEALGVKSIDLIDFNYPCYHQLCDDLSHVSGTSLDEVGETVRALLPRL